MSIADYRSSTINNSTNSMRHVARVMYDGRFFRGWQSQSLLQDVRTVQGVLSTNIRKRFNDQQIHVMGASRTDIGVHARGQVFHFDTNIPIDDYAHLQFALNQMLPADVKLFAVTKAPDCTYNGAPSPFHAILSATGKHYKYRFTTNDFVEPCLSHYCTHFYRKINMAIFHECLQLFVGTHNFQAFANASDNSKNFKEAGLVYDTLRTIHSIKLNDEGNGYYSIDFQIQSALYKMIRNIVGASHHVATGQMEFNTLRALLNDGGCKRTDNKARAADPQGLCLERVYYDNY